MPDNYKKYLHKLVVHGFSCSCCTKDLPKGALAFCCEDCGAVVCAECAEKGEVADHICFFDDDEDVEDEEI